MRYTSPPPPPVVKTRLWSIQKLLVKLAVEYTGAYEDGYLGTRTNFDEDAGVRSSGHKDPVGDLVVSKLHSGIRSNTTTAANRVEEAFFALKKAIDELDRYKRGLNG